MEGPGDRVALRDQLAEQIGRDRFDLWVADDTKIDMNEAGNVDMRFASGFLCDIARRNLNHDLTVAAQRLVGPQAQVILRVDETAAAPISTPAATRVAPQPRPRLQIVETPAEPNAPQVETAKTPVDGTFKSLVVGRANELAVRAGIQMATGNHVGGPLVVWGPPGTGKSHLLSAIKQAYKGKFRRARVLSLSAEQFVSTYVEALRGGGLPNFRQKCRGANLLIIDDLHFMAGKRATLEELQHTLDSVTAAGGQVVLASCQEPGNIANLGEELLSRLRAGLVCEVATADYATRLEIARRRCELSDLPIDDHLLERLAAGVSSGARELIGAIERLRAHHELLGLSIDLRLVDQIVEEINHQTTRCVAMDDIQRVVCDHFGIAAKTLCSTSRMKSVTEPRMLAMWLARKYTRAGWREIGEYFGGRRHSTVISAHRRIEAQMGRESGTASHSGPNNLEDTVVAIETKLRLA